MTRLLFSTTATLLLCCGVSTAYSISSDPVTVNPEAQAYYDKYVEKYGETEEFSEKLAELYAAAQGKLEVCRQKEANDCSYYRDLKHFAAPEVIIVEEEK